MANFKIKECKEQARKTPIEVFPDPKMAIVLTNQHAGAPNKPLVSVGDVVKAGQKIADSKEKISAPVHSPISGKVVKIGDIYNSCYGECSEAIFIQNDGKKTKDKTLSPISESELNKTSNNVLIKIIREAGIIGLGGAGFPTHVKLSPPPNIQIKNLVINATEGEPYDTADERIMIENTKNLLRGVRIIRKILGNPKVIVATKVSKSEAILKLQEVFGQEPNTKIVARAFTYQQGDASLLQKALFGYENSPTKRSYESGTIVQNVSTVNAIANAVFEGDPLIYRVITLSGDIPEPKNLLVKIGTPIEDILNKYIIDKNDLRKVVVGGVMMGDPITTIEAPVTKRTSSIIVFSKSKYKLVKRETDCIHCSTCISACPVKLYPILIYNAVMEGNLKKAEELYMKDCIRCGMCSYVCPAGLPLAATICGPRH